jgi:hypothetical protein
MPVGTSRNPTTVADVLAEILTEHFPQTSLKCYCYSDLFSTETLVSVTVKLLTPN